MKSIILILFVITLVGCNKEEPRPNYFEDYNLEDIKKHVENLDKKGELYDCSPRIVPADLKSTQAENYRLNVCDYAKKYGYEHVIEGYEK